jgi:ABC-type sugar transport system permease subunit
MEEAELIKDKGIDKWKEKGDSKRIIKWNKKSIILTTIYLTLIYIIFFLYNLIFNLNLSFYNKNILKNNCFKIENIYLNLHLINIYIK